MSNYFKIIITLLILCSPMILSQSSIGIFTGLPFASNYYSSVTVLKPDMDARKLKPGITIGFETDVFITTINGLNLYGHSEFGYSKVLPKGEIIATSGSTGKSSFDGYIQRVPMQIGLKVKSESNFTPFLEISAGIAHTRYLHSASNDDRYSFDISAWQFSWATGAGLSYKINESIGLESFIKVWFTEEDLTQQVPYEKIGIVGQFAFITYGLSTYILI